MNLALRYRPLCFEQILGQDFIKNYFRNSFVSQNLAQVFLFTGTRGIGKTSLARIVAKCFNCAHSQHPSYEICQKCENCTTIDKSNNVDVLEFDAASHTGVTDIRQILESMQYTPVNSRYKIYIIDEVHMLSQSAFNALLKTLEEPPAHVIFVLATTEMQKIPITILSRCQIFQLKLPNDIKLQEYFCQIAKKEGYELDNDAAKIITNQSDGSIRDGLSLLQQIILTSDIKIISATQVKKILHIIDENSLQQILLKLINGDTQESLKIFQYLLEDGFNSLHILKGLLEYVYINIQESRKTFSMRDLHHIWQILLKGMQNCKNNSFHKMIVEMTLLQIAQVKIIQPPQELIQNIKNTPQQKNINISPNININCESSWQNIQMQIKQSDSNLYNLIHKYVTNGIIIEEKLTLIFTDEHNDENELRALTIKNQIKKYIKNIDVLIKFEKRNMQNLSEKIKNNFQIKE